MTKTDNFEAYVPVRICRDAELRLGVVCANVSRLSRNDPTKRPRARGAIALMALSGEGGSSEASRLI